MPGTCEFDPLAFYSGLPDVPRVPAYQALNNRAMARAYAESVGRNYEELNLLVVTLGGGITVTAHRKGKMVDAQNGITGDGAFATVLKGQVDAILLIGGMANSQYIVDLIRDRVEFIAPVAVQPGEREMESLCLNAYRGLTGQIEIKNFREGKVHVPVF